MDDTISTAVRQLATGKARSVRSHNLETAVFAQKVCASMVAVTTKGKVGCRWGKEIQIRKPLFVLQQLLPLSNMPVSG